MIQTRRNIFETNSSSTHCLTIMDRSLYDDWRNGKVALSIDYVFDTIDKDKKNDIAPVIRLPLNFKSEEEAKIIAQEKDNTKTTSYRYVGLDWGDNGFMSTSGNFWTHAPIVRSINIKDQVNENIKLLNNFIRDNKQYVNYLVEANKFNKFIDLINEYQDTGLFADEMFSFFPPTLYYNADEYSKMLLQGDCSSPFIHVFEKYVALGYYFHS